MADNRGTNDTSNQNSCYESYSDYLKRAAQACEAGDLLLGMHLYLAAYERAVADPDIPDGMALAGLREAWNLACDLKERSMAEYVFEKLEPFLTSEEIAACASELQNLALDRLESYGFSREELQNMAEMISQDYLGGEGSIVKVESISIPAVVAGAAAEPDELSQGDEAPAADGEAEKAQSAQAEPPSAPTAEKAAGKPSHVGMGNAPVNFNPYDEFNTSSVGKSYHAATNEGAGSYVFTRDKDRAAEAERAADAQATPNAPAAQDDAVEPAQGESAQALSADEEAARQEDASQQQAAAPALASTVSAQLRESSEGDGAQGRAGTSPALSVPAVKAPGAPARDNEAELPSLPQVPEPGERVFNYANLAGYSKAIAAVRELGVGMERDQGFKNFIGMMNSRHGLERMPAIDTLLFRSFAVEDATRFVDATIGEIGLPVLRMSMEEGFQGAPVLCVTTYGDSRPRMNHAHNRFDGPAILVLDDLDTWSMPQSPENAEGLMGLMMANVSRGAREAINMIRSAVEDPDVYVLATASFAGEVDPFFYEILEPLSIVEIALPDEQERDEMWREIMYDHPSTRLLDRKALVRLSAGLPRYDIYMAARAALEDAYKAGLAQRKYLAVTAQNMYDKLAACLPLDSDEYRAVEDEAVQIFRSELDDLDSLLGDQAD